MKYIIIGLGNYGGGLAEELMAMTMMPSRLLSMLMLSIGRPKNMM